MSGKVTIPLYHGDDFERMADLRREVDIAERNVEAARTKDFGTPRRIGDEDTSVTEAEARLQAAREAFTAFVDEAAERAETWVLQTIGHEDYRRLLRDHPPRKVSETVDGTEREVTHPDDLVPGDVNTETFPKALLLFVDPEDEEHRTVLEPFESEAALRRRVKRLSAGEFDTMWITAHQWNGGLVADPKASPYYGGALRSDAT